MEQVRNLTMFLNPTLSPKARRGWDNQNEPLLSRNRNSVDSVDTARRERLHPGVRIGCIRHNRHASIGGDGKSDHTGPVCTNIAQGVDELAGRIGANDRAGRGPGVIGGRAPRQVAQSPGRGIEIVHGQTVYAVLARYEDILAGRRHRYIRDRGSGETRSDAGTGRCLLDKWRARYLADASRTCLNAVDVHDSVHLAASDQEIARRFNRQSVDSVKIEADRAGVGDDGKRRARNGRERSRRLVNAEGVDLSFLVAVAQLAAGVEILAAGIDG